MATVAQKSFFAHLYDAPGVLTKVNGALTFFSDAGNIITIEPADCTWLTVLGEVGIAETQRIMDRIHGGYAQVACRRLQEVA